MLENTAETLKWELPGPPESYLNHSDENARSVPGYLMEFHSHAPSEHTVDGEHRDLEMQFVH